MMAHTTKIKKIKIHKYLIHEFDQSVPGSQHKFHVYFHPVG